METSNWEQKLTIRSAEIDPNNLVEVLEKVNSVLPKDEQFCYLMADYWNGPGCFAYFSAGQLELSQRLFDCMGGSAFGKSAELRWRKVGNKLRLALIAEADLNQLPLQCSIVQWENEQTEVKRCKDRKIPSILLWGTNYMENHRQWFEARIPRPLSYPIDPQMDGVFTHVGLHFVEYQDERGRAVIQRRTHLTAHLTRDSDRNAQKEQKGVKDNGKEIP